MISLEPIIFSKLELMIGNIKKPIGLIIISIITMSCSGDGVGVDANGHADGWEYSTNNNNNDIGNQSASHLLSQIQKEIFDPICNTCHRGQNAPNGLILTSDNIPNIISSPSAAIEEINIVEPGDPDQSYIVWKIEGRAGILGAKMPRAFAPLTEDQIQLINDWILALGN